MIVASAIIIVVYIVVGYVVAFRDQTAALTVSAVSSMRFTPIGLIVISTVLHNQGGYLTPALLFAFVDTIIPFAVAAEVGHLISRRLAPKVTADMPTPNATGAPPTT